MNLDLAYSRMFISCGNCGTTQENKDAHEESKEPRTQDAASKPK
jgi:hypothetical protein